MQVHSLETISALKRFRKRGVSIQELMRIFNVPKSTVWHHIHNIQLSHEQAKKIRARQGGSRIRSEKQWEQAHREAQQIVNSANIREIAPSLVSTLYWAEGSKRSFVFTNTDENMIRVFLKILRSYFKVKNSEIFITPRIGESADSKKAIFYWKRVTGAPLKNIKTNINFQHNKSKAKYGICRVSVRKGGYLLKVINCMNAELTSKIKSSILEQ